MFENDDFARNRFSLKKRLGLFLMKMATAVFMRYVCAIISSSTVPMIMPPAFSCCILVADEDHVRFHMLYARVQGRSCTFFYFGVSVV